ncbi:MAG: hypothetical protein MUC97_04970 [Bernardetiaceae bacterium]|jgi:hypothetical protein|nr:hypothetical protein [Bernardetiaceae bacterium]
MKTASLCLLGLSLAFSSLAQTRNDSLTFLFRQLGANLEHIRRMEAQRRADSLRIAELQKNLSDQASNFSTTVSAVDMRVKEFDQRMKITDRDRYAIISKNLVNSVELFDMLNQRLNILEAINQIEDYQALIINLNNPANEDLGFSYNKKVNLLMDQYIAANTGRDRSKILTAAKVVLENPLVSTVAGPVGAPILGVSNALLSFATTLFVNRKDVPEENLVKFRDEVNKYTQYYVRLNELNRNFSVNLNNYQLQTANLQTKLKEFVVQNVQATGGRLDPNEEKRQANTAAYVTSLLNTYNANSIRNYLGTLERNALENNQVNYNKLVRSGNLVDMNKRVGEVIFLYKEFEYLYSQYISALDKNNREMVLVLQEVMANKLSDDDNKVRQQMARLEKEKNSAVEAINKAINLPRMKAVVDQLDTFYPSL